MTATPITPPPVVPPKINRHWPLRFAVIGVSLLIYVVACATPAIYWSTQGRIEAMPGIRGLAGGWWAILYGNFAWCANLLLFLACIGLIVGFWRTTMVIALLAALLAMQSFMLLGVELPADEGDMNKMKAVSLGIGFYFWIGSMLVPFLGALWLKLISKPRTIS